ncbi:MAG: NAD(P)H-dependent glycerol-3-phosphate dehydrogenase [Actinomycetes bacterium]
MGRKLVVVGAGSWGTALASIAAPQCPTVIWARSAVTADEIEIRHTNERYLPGLGLSAELAATSNLEVALKGADAVLMAVPSHGTRAILEQAASWIAPRTPVFSLSKGIEADTMMRMSEVITSVVPHATAGVLTGPNLAGEIAQGQPAACIVASEEQAAAEMVQSMLHSATLRVYSSTDVIGCEIAGATKNVLAIAAGIATGFGFGDNTRSALITRGLAEMGRLGITLGGQTLTFGGLAGVGDLIATCTSEKSRNRTVGFALGQGRDLVEIIDSMHMVAEGVKTAGPLVRLAAAEGIEMPICEQVAQIVAGTATPRQALLNLMERPARVEWDETLYRGLVHDEP